MPTDEEYMIVKDTYNLCKPNIKEDEVVKEVKQKTYTKTQQ